MPTGDAAVTVLLAEYTALRTEIDRRSHAQQTLLNLALTVTGALLAYAVAHEVVTVLLLQPIVVCALGLLYADHAFMIRRIGLYLRNHTAPCTSRSTGESRLLDWEESPERSAAKGWRLMWVGPPVLIFVAAPVAVLAFSLGAEVVGPARRTELLTAPLPVVALLSAVDVVLIGLVCCAFYFPFRKGALERAVDVARRARDSGAAG